MNRYVIISLLGIFTSCSIFKKGSSSNAPERTPAAADVGISKNGVKPYHAVINSNLVRQHGLFDVHTTPERDTVYFEIDEKILGREILTINRVAKVGAGMEIYSGDILDNVTIFFERGPHETILLKRYNPAAKVDKSNPLERSVNAAYQHPIIASFPILAYGVTGKSYVIDVTGLLKDPKSFVNSLGKGLGSHFVERDLKDHAVRSIRVYPLNIECNISKNGIANQFMDPLPTTFESHTSFILLPEIPMSMRIFDQRVGYFNDMYVEYGDSSQLAPKYTQFIKRWRLEPKPEDWEKYNRGELVEPIKPIVFYIDPATPKQWVKYMIDGINAWQEAFEQAGFKNAIWGKEWPENDSMNVEDMRYSFIRYFPSKVMNAYGPHVNDPRTGEIIQTNVGWFNNIMTILHDWYQVQVGQGDPRSRFDLYDTDLMGRLIKMVSSHEIGHTLGLRHNFGASHNDPVDSLRSITYLRKHGHSPSLMDYARNVYVVQPEDSIPPELFIPRINDYDKWAIEWGYRLNQNATALEDQKIMSKLTTERLAANKRLEWGNGEDGIGKGRDPRNQREDIGDDGVKASLLGIKNLKLIMDSLTKWNVTETGFNDFSRMYKAVLLQYSNYLEHTGNIVGGFYATAHMDDSEEPLCTPVEREKQLAAIDFINNELFTTPTWLLVPSFLNKFDNPVTKDNIEDYQEKALDLVQNAERFRLIIDMEKRFGKERTLGIEELQAEMRKVIWKDMDNEHLKIDGYIRNMQKRYVVNLFAILMDMNAPMHIYSEIGTVVKEELQLISDMVGKALPRAADEVTKSHLYDLQVRIKRLSAKSKVSIKQDLFN